MAISDDMEKVLGDFGLKLNTDTRSSLRKKLNERRAGYKIKNSRTESNLEASIFPSVSYDKGSIRFTLTMNDYWEVVNDGRKPSNVSEEGQDSLREWARVSGFAETLRISNLAFRKKQQDEAKSESKSKRKWKNLKKMPFEQAKKSAGFIVARSLKNKSIEPTHFFDEVIKDGRIDELKQRLNEIIKKDIIIEIKQVIKK